MTNWIAVVDDDMTTLKMAGRILSNNNMRVSAMNSGKALLTFMKDNRPDIVLLDISMPDMDGFETLKLLRIQEKNDGYDSVPVIFLTADEDKDSEKKGLELGASDYVRKPFVPDVLLHRIQNIVANNETIKNLEEEASIDKLTGFLNKSAVDEKLQRICHFSKGMLVMADLDSFKLVNDIYGHDMGDKVLSMFAGLIKQNTRKEDILGRVGGDEFIIFIKNIVDEYAIKRICENINTQLMIEAKKMMGEDMHIPLGASMGVVFVPMQGSEYEKLYSMADKALYRVKKNGKHDFELYASRDEFGSEHEGVEVEENADLEHINMILKERSAPSSALWVGNDAFTQLYRFFTRYIESYRGHACKVLFNFSVLKDIAGLEKNFQEMMEDFGEILKNLLRKSDIMVQSKANQFLLLLPEVDEDHLDSVLDRIEKGWSDYEYSDYVAIIYEREMVVSEDVVADERRME